MLVQGMLVGSVWLIQETNFRKDVNEGVLVVSSEIEGEANIRGWFAIETVRLDSRVIFISPTVSSSTIVFVKDHP